MRVRVLLLLLLWYCLPPGAAHALDPGKAFEHYIRDGWSVPEGMPQVSATSIAQTPDGYLWIGTQAGLARFDGVNFSTFSPANEPALPNQVVVTLAVGAEGELWIGTRNGMAVLRAGQFATVPWDGEGEPPMIFRLHRAGDGGIWAATSSGVARVVDGRLQPLPGPAAASAITSTADGAIWAGTAGGVSRWDGKAWVVTTWAGVAPPVADLVVLDGRVWAATGSGLHVHGASGWEPVPGASGADGLNSRFILRDRDGSIWAGGHRGMVRIAADGAVEHVPATGANGLANLISAFEDREGNLWLGSMSNGLVRLWNGWTRRFSTAQGLPEPTVWAIGADPRDGGLWVGTNEGVAHVGADGQVTRLPADAEATGVTYAFLAEPDRLWIGMRHGLALYEPGSGAPARTPEWARGISAAVAGLTRDVDGNLWIGTINAMFRWDGSTLEQFDAARGLPTPLAEYRLVTLGDGRRMAMTHSGLFEFDGDGFRPAPESRDLPEGIKLHGLYELSDGRLLLTSEDELMLLRHQGRWHRLDADSGLFAGIAYQVLERDGALWISSTPGVYRLQLEQLTAFVEGRIGQLDPQMLVSERGLAGGDLRGVCCSGAGAHDGLFAGDTFWVPTRDGVLAIDTADIIRNPHPPDVRLGRIQAGGQWRTLPSAGAALEAGERDLVLAFEVLSFQDPRSNQVRYRLAGYDREWKTAASMVREVHYTNLPPGDYAFEVMASNNAGVWTAEPARLEFSIRPHFHETAAFRMLLVALALLLVYAGYRTQRYRYRMRQAELERLVDVRTAALADSNRQLEQASLTDPLTGLRNRRYLAQQIPADLSYYGRQRTAVQPDSMVFAMLDLDHFKQVNDVYGHAVGDQVLEEAARRLRALVRAGDYVVRWGGEEFLLVLRPMPADHVMVMGERLRGAIAGLAFDIGEERSISLTASVGLSEYPLFRNAGQPLGWEAMIELADQAAYYVKRNGRDGWALFRPTPATRVETLLADLQQGAETLIREGALELHGSHQPAHRRAQPADVAG